MDKQILFLYSALKGFLDQIPVDIIRLFEYELYSYYSGSVFNYPVSRELKIKKNYLNPKTVPSFIWDFSFEFFGFIKANKLIS